MRKGNAFDILADAVESGDYQAVMTCPVCGVDSVLDGCIVGPVKTICSNCKQEVESLIVLMPVKEKEVQS